METGRKEAAQAKGRAEVEAAQALAEKQEAKGRAEALQRDHARLHAELDDLRSEMSSSRQKVTSAPLSLCLCTPHNPYLCTLLNPLHPLTPPLTHPHLPPTQPHPPYLSRDQVAAAMEGMQAQAGRRHAWDAERKELLAKLAATKGGSGGGSGGVRYATPIAPEGFTGVANNLLRGLFSKSDAPHSHPTSSNIYVGSASNWPL